MVLHRFKEQRQVIHARHFLSVFRIARRRQRRDTSQVQNVALMGVAGSDCYTAAKGGISAIARSLAVAYAPQRVRVTR
jgi:NAD(P)-dependent dehydrogenase (short-subunit alcohol dehydrogenase family)